MPEIISRKEAMALGLKLYFTGIPCPHRHLVERRVSSKDCVKCSRLGSEKWRRKNLERARQAHRLAAKKRMAADPEGTREAAKRKNKKWQENHPDKYKSDYRRRYYQGPLNPKDETQWLSKAKALLRTAKRTLKKQQQEAHR